MARSSGLRNRRVRSGLVALRLARVLPKALPHLMARSLGMGKRVAFKKLSFSGGVFAESCAFICQSILRFRLGINGRLKGGERPQAKTQRATTQASASSHAATT
jgi:hypothetical protein